MKRASWLPAVLSLAGVALTAAVIWGDFGARGTGALALDVPASGETTLTVTWVGDTMVGDASEPFARQYGYLRPFEHVSALLDADVVIANHEAPITAIRTPFNPEKLYSYAADPLSAEALRTAGITVLGLANNHVMDMGPAGLTDTLAHAQRAGLTCFGAGADDSQAERPLLIDNGTVTLGVVALAKGYGSSVTAGRDRAGTVALSEAAIARGYALAKKAGADYVVGFVHWGENYEPQVLDEQRRIAREFSAAGYDIVIGHGPHIPQRAEVVGGMPVVYSLGNFVFGTPGSFDEHVPGEGVLVTTAFTAEGLVSLSATCIDTDNDRVAFQPVQLEPESSAALLDRLGYASVIDRFAGSGVR